MDNHTESYLWWNSSSQTEAMIDQEADYQWKFSLAGRIRSAFAFITIFVGVVGNGISFKVMTSKTMRATSTGVYFAAIAISDTATLLTGQVSALLYHVGDFNVISIHYWSCRWFFVLLFTFGDTAVWLMLAVTVDRFISVVFPLKRRELCTPTRSLICCVCLVVGALLKNVHIFWTRGRQDITEPDGVYVIEVVECGFPTPAYEHFETYIRPWVAFTLYAFIPLSGLVVLNMAIAVSLWQHSKSRVGGNKTEDGSNQAETSAGGSKASRQAAQLTVMLLTVSVAFTILISPSIIVLIAKPYLATTPALQASYSLIEAVVDTLAYVNHSTNFFFYCLSGAGFRKEVHRIFRCDRNKVNPTNETSMGNDVTVAEK